MKPCNNTNIHHYFSTKPNFHFKNSTFLCRIRDKMVREYVERSGGGVALSVVPLLQERFRRLQRMKELREEKELLRMLSESERCSPPTKENLMSENFLSGSQLMFLPPKPQCQLSLSLCPDSSPVLLKHADSAPKSLFTDAPLVCTLPIKIDINSAASDIDTSLRL